MSLSEYSKESDRTTDVQTLKETSFSKYVSDPKILNGLTDSGFTVASPIQIIALPTVISGRDTVIKAKNGTGKTLTFVLPTLMKLKLEKNQLQAIVLAPTREIAFQIQQCFNQVGQYLSELKCEYFIGGTSVETDKEKAACCQIAVGTLGRIKHLLNDHILNGSELKILIIDEVDRLLNDRKCLKDVRWIDAKLPKLKQVIFASASFDKKTVAMFDEFMNEYSVASGKSGSMNDTKDPSKFLLGIKQYVACVKAVNLNIILLPAKNIRLLNILQNVAYTQCIIFTNFMTRAETICNWLRDHHFKADFIRGDQDQKIRLKLVHRLMNFKSTILVATDLMARGINSSNVDLVINMDCPNNSATYLHRIGRAGRFGNKATAVSILDDGIELQTFKKIINHIEYIKIKIIPTKITKPLYEYTDEEIEILDLSIKSDEIKENSNNITEENKIENNGNDNSELMPSISESNVNNEPICDNVVLTTDSDIPTKHQNGNNVTEENSNNKTEENKIENNGNDDSELMPSISESNVNNEPICDNVVLTTDSDVPTKHQNGNNVTEENSNNKTEENKIENNGNDDSELMPCISESNVNNEPIGDNVVLTTDSDVPTKHQNGNNVTEENSNNKTEENKIENNGNDDSELMPCISESNVNNEPIGDNVVLTTNSDVPTKHQNVNNTTEENSNNVTEEGKIENSGNDLLKGMPSVPESNVNSNPLSHYHTPEVIALEKLSKIVRKTEKKLIDENLIDKKFLTEDRTFILFNPEILFDVTAQYENYCIQDIVNIIIKFNSDFKKFDDFKAKAAKNEVNDINDSGKQNQSLEIDKNTSENISEINDFSFESNQYDLTDIESDSSLSSPQRNTNVIDLFNLHNFEVLLPSKIKENTNDCDQNNYAKEEFKVNEENKGLKEYNEKLDSDIISENSDETFDEDTESENSYEYVESDNYNEDIESEQSDNNIESENSDENIAIKTSNEDTESDNDYFEFENSDGDIESLNSVDDIESHTSVDDIEKHKDIHSFKYNNKSVKKLNYNITQTNNITPQRVINKIETEIIDYDVLNDWYTKCKQQMDFIRACMKSSK